MDLKFSHLKKWTFFRFLNLYTWGNNCCFHIWGKSNLMFHRAEEIKLEFIGRSEKFSFPKQEFLLMYMHFTKNFYTYHSLKILNNFLYHIWYIKYFDNLPIKIEFFNSIFIHFKKIWFLKEKWWDEHGQSGIFHFILSW